MIDVIGTVDETALVAALRDDERVAKLRTVGKVRDDELDPAYRNRLLDAFKHFRD